MLKISMGLAAALVIVGWLYIQSLQALGEKEQALKQVRQDLEYQTEQTKQALADKEAAEALLTNNRSARETTRAQITRLRAQLQEDRRHASEEYQACTDVPVPEPTYLRLRALADAADAHGH